MDQGRECPGIWGVDTPRQTLADPQAVSIATSHQKLATPGSQCGATPV